MPKHNATVSLKGWLGINNVLRPERTDLQFLKEALNVDLDKSGGVAKRLGYTKESTGVYHSLWSERELCYCVKDEELIKIEADLTETVIETGIQCRLSFARTPRGVLVVGDTFRGIISGTSITDFGIEGSYPVLVSTSGILDAGLYQVAITYLYADGTESGTGVSVEISVGALGGIIVNMLPSPDPSVTDINIYCSTPDGDTLYLVKTVSSGTTSTTISSISGAVSPLISFNMSPSPYGQIVAIYKGRALVADGDTLWFSEPYSYHWFNKHSNYFQFESEIVAVMPVEDGVWIGTKAGLYYIQGRDIEAARVELKEPVSCMRGTDVRIQGSYIFIDNTPIGYKWLISTKTGIFICFNDGITLNMTEKNYTLPDADQGAGAFVQRDGINRYLAILDKKKDGDNSAVGDQVSATIIRNGIVLED